MIVVKYFAEEPAAFEPAAGPETPTLEAFMALPRLYRGYLSATDLETHQSGATVVTNPEAWARPLGGLFSSWAWWSPGPDEPDRVEDPVSALATATRPVLLVSPVKPDGERARAAERELSVSGPEGRAVRAALALEGVVVLWREKGFDGFDWSLLANEPLQARVREAFVAYPLAGVRRFVIPLREARGEHRFHFERYDLEAFALHEVR